MLEPLAELNCRNFEDHVQEIMDARRLPSADPQVMKHVAKCADCSAELARYERLDRILDSAFQTSKRKSKALNCELPKLAQSVARDQKHKSGLRRIGSRPAPTSLVATIALLMLTAAWSFRGGDELGNSPVVSGTVAPSPSSNDIQLASNFRSFERCYEITAEMPGVRPLQSTLNLAFDWCQDFFSASPNGTKKPTDQTPQSNLPNLGLRFNEGLSWLC